MKSLGTGFLLSLSLCLDLGIVNVAILQTALRQGGAAGFLIGLGSSAGDLIYFTLAVLGATAFLGWPAVRWGLWLFGTGVLLFLTGRMAREVILPKKVDLDALELPLRRTSSGLLVAGVGLALASPSSMLWFAAIGGSVLASAGGDQLSLLGLAAGFAGGGIAWSAALAYSTAHLKRVMGVHVVRVLSLVSALVFLYFAVVVFLSGLELMR